MTEVVPKVILIVDDNDFQRRIVGTILEAEGYAPVFAASGTEALQAVQSILPSLILLDFQMPDMNGTAVLEQLKVDPRFAAVPVIMVSGSGEKEVILATCKLGAVDFIVKPFNRNTLLTKIARVIDTPWAAHQSQP